MASGALAIAGAVESAYGATVLLSSTRNMGSDMQKLGDAMNSSEGAGSSIKFGSDTKSIQKLSNQMTQRGWTEGKVRNTVSSPHTTRISTNKATGNSATVYYNKSGGYVIIDDVTKAVVQVSDNINPYTWIPDPSIVNPYKP